MDWTNTTVTIATAVFFAAGSFVGGMIGYVMGQNSR